MPTKTIASTKSKVLKKKPEGVQKKVTKKTTVAKKKTAKKELVIATDETSFWVVDGQILNSLVALKGALTEMEKSVYLHHVEGGRNDFATWVETVLQDTACAADLKKAKTVSAAKTAATTHLKFYRV